ncbi:MAG: 5-formyltetrahydrofolate cyclo-ligase [Lachnospiraceae bacterium]|nr:5-formyltetrahydrofolate cyclo-ligase [Lachnospiraceae bacterium]
MSEESLGKEHFRNLGKEAREAIREPERSRLVRRMEEALFRTGLWNSTKALLLYSPIFGEVSTKGIFTKAKAAGKEVYYPKTRKEGLSFFRVDSLAQLKPSTMGIPEPEFSGEEAQARLFEKEAAHPGFLAIIPGIAFSKAGDRLGHGAGYYDRFLSSCRRDFIKIGMAFECQVFPKLPAQEYDIAMDCLLTEEGIRTVEKLT